MLLQPRPRRNAAGLGSFPFDRHYSGNRYFLSLPPGTEMFQFPGFTQINLVHGLQPCRLPHSDTFGSIPVCSSPNFFAAYHVLLRLRKPRHPPFALVTFLLNELHFAKYNFLHLHSLNFLVCLEIVVPNLSVSKITLVLHLMCFFDVLRSRFGRPDNYRLIFQLSFLLTS